MLRILHTNDFHGALDDTRERQLAGLREQADCYFDCGDCIKAGNLAVPLRADPAWQRLDRLRCTASVLGNRETHVLRGAFDKKIEGASHPILCANVRLKSGERPFPGSLQLDVAGIKVGVIGVMVAMVTERMATQGASAYLWDPPIPTATALAEEFRPQVDCLIALTHIGLKQDREMAARCGLFDLILGAHSHDALQEPVVIGRTAICQTGSHGRYAGVYAWSSDGLVDHALVPLER